MLKHLQENTMQTGNHLNQVLPEEDAMKSTGSLLWYSLAFPDLPRLWLQLGPRKHTSMIFFPKIHTQVNYEETSNKLTDYQNIAL